MHYQSIQNICEQIFRIENQYNLLDYEVDSVKLWQYLRMPIYYRLAQKCNVLSDPHPVQNSIFRRAGIGLSCIKSALCHNPLFSPVPLDAIFVDHNRSKSYNHIPIDIYSDFLLKKMVNKGKRVCILEKPFCGFHARKPSPFRRHLDIIEFYHRWNLLSGKCRVSANALERIAWLNLLINNSFDIDGNFTPLLVHGLKQFISHYRFYEILLSRLKPKQLFVVVGYNYLGDLIKAAKNKGIEVIEIQHGVLSRYHIGYSFPGREEKLDYFPDVFLSWGTYWNELIDLPLPRHKIIAIGFDYFHHMKARYAGVVRKKKQLLILSQGAIGPALSERIRSLVTELQGFKIVYKLHPSEYKTFRLDPNLCFLSTLDNVRMISHDCDLYRLFAQSEYQLGVFSTAIFEGIGMECKTILFDLPGIEYMAKLIQNGFAVVYSEKSGLKANLKSADKIQSAEMTENIFGNFPNGEFIL